MEPKDAKFEEMRILICELVDGTITPDRRIKLNQILANDPEAVNHYIDFLDIQVLIKSNMSNIEKDFSAPLCSDELQELAELWRQLAKEERSAPEVKIAEGKPSRELIQKVVCPPKEKRKLSKFNKVILAINAAAILFFVLFLKFAPPKGGIEVATLNDSINAEWANTKGAFQKGDRITAGEKMILNRGLVELVFDNGARAVLEAPIEFKVLAEDRIGLTYGKVYATVPEKAIGFSVYTPVAKIVDMGTAFGVEADSSGDTQLHVLEGKTVLMVGQHENAVNIEVGVGRARKVSGGTQTVTEIPLRENYFVRAFDSTHNIVWRQQLLLDLADIVSNGNGLGTGNSGVRLNHEKGFTNEKRWGHTSTFKDYLLIKDHPFIDGIFIPNGKTVVSSQGDVFDGFPSTNGIYCADLFASPDPGLFVIDGQPRTIQFDGQEYSDRGKSCIVMQHSNHGITFDLNAIRNRYTLRIDRFTSRVGLIDFVNKRCNANLYVLVDGQLRYSLLGYNQKGVLNDVSVKLEDSDRFLTLATSENVDQDNFMANSTLYENWWVFAEPVLMFE